MDADLSHPPNKINEFVYSLKESDLIIGSRNLPGGSVEEWPFHRKIISWGATVLAQLLVNSKISDPMSGFFAIKKKYFLKTRFRVKGYKILLNILADNPNIKIKEIPYVFRNRFAGTTKLGMYEMAIYLIDLAKIWLG
jgi:dolichol-phosphate mannosyltransferase